jgi:c-di-GMP-binding flagellar brake protein YcgR
MARKNNMEEKRRFKRFSVDIMDINGNMILSTYVKILDISIGGISFKANRRLNMGGEYSMKMKSKGGELTVKGIIVRSALSESISDSWGNIVPVYSAGMQFTDASEEKIKEIEAFIMNNMKYEDMQVDLHSPSDHRLYVRVFIENPEQSVLKVDENYKVKKVSLGGMMIESEYALELESIVPLEIYFVEDNSLKVTGRVVSCIMITDQEPMHYNIGMAFIEMSEKDRELLLEFIRSLDKPAG